MAQTCPMRRLLLSFGLLSLPLFGSAQSVEPCDQTTNSAALDIRSFVDVAYFANGDVALYLMDTVEPAAAAFNLVIEHPPYDDQLGFPSCHVVGPFSGLLWDGRRADYDPAVGLQFFIEAQVYKPDSATFVPVEAEITVNQATGLVGLETRWLD